MGMMSRTKGKAGEREAAAIIRDISGWDIQRRVRQHDGDSDLLGVNGWVIEVKRYAKADRADIRTWWTQAVEQSKRHSGIPVLIYRRDRDEWRCVWPIAPHLTHQEAVMWEDYTWTVETSIDAWVAAVREITPEAA